MKLAYLPLLLGLLAPAGHSPIPLLTPVPTATRPAPVLQTGADQVSRYLPYLKGKRIGMVVNQTSIIGNKPSVDSLVSLGVNVVSIFGPEHGFRGNASNGAKVDDSVDPKTGIPIISLYGKNKKPSKEQLDKIDLLVYDIQDVGCRFYTYINTLDHGFPPTGEQARWCLDDQLPASGDRKRQENHACSFDCLQLL